MFFRSKIKCIITIFLNTIQKKEEPEIISNAETGLTRGRPKKRPGEAVLKSDVVELAPPKLCVSTSRTRCGRITKPPTHMEKV